MSVQHGTRFQSCGKLLQFEYIMSINIRLLLHEGATQCCMSFHSMLTAQFIPSVQVGPNVLLARPPELDFCSIIDHSCGNLLYHTQSVSVRMYSVQQSIQVRH